MAGLPWIKVEVALPNHPKLEALEQAIRVEDALGIVIRMWCWTAAYYADGRIPAASILAMEKVAMRDLTITYTDNDMFAAGGPIQAGELVEALTVTGWLDRDGDYYVVHDWEEFHAAHADKAKKNRERQARFRQRHRALPARNAPVTPDGNGQ